MEFDEKGLEKIFKNLANPAKIPIAGGHLQEINAYAMSRKSKMRIEGARKMAKFYKTIGHPLDPDDMSWVVIKNFLEQHNALKDQKYFWGNCNSEDYKELCGPPLAQILPYFPRKEGWSSSGLTHICCQRGVVG